MVATTGPRARAAAIAPATMSNPTAMLKPGSPASRIISGTRESSHVRTRATSGGSCPCAPAGPDSRRATDRRTPHAIPIYAIRVADDFHRFYHEHRVLESEQEAFRLELVRAVRIVIARCLDLVGVDAPERM